MLFDGANLQRAVFVRARLEDVRIRNADLRNADFTDARLEDAFLNGSDVRNAKFIRTDLTGAVFGRVSGTRDAEWRDTVCPDGRKSDDCPGDGAMNVLR